MPGIEDALDPHVARYLLPGEPILARLIANRVAMFSGPIVGVCVTPDRLIVQQFTRKQFQPDGEAIVLDAEDIERFKATSRGDWRSLESNPKDSSNVRLKLRLSDGQKLILTAMRGDATVLGRVGGAEIQREGLNLLGEWIDRHGIVNR